MKRVGKQVLFWSGLAVTSNLFIVLLFWSLIPFSGETLPHLLEKLWKISFHISAGFVSFICGLLAAGAIGLTLLIPIPRSVVKSEIM